MTVPASRRRRRVPQFVIIGAMKAGTTTLHRLLVASGGIAIPDAELVLFDVDDPSSHPRLHRQMLRYGPVTFAENFDQLFDVYTAHFDGYGEDVMLGEDSTTYLYSRSAPARMAAVLGDVRVIVMLRDPVERAISHYYHQVRARTLALPLERAVIEDATILGRSTYAPGLGHFADVLGRDRIHVEFTEDLAHDPASVLNRVRGFLGLEPVRVADIVVANRGRYPTRVRPLLWRNRIMPNRLRLPSGSRLPRAHGSRLAQATPPRSAWTALERLLGGPVAGQASIEPSVRSYLASVLRVANQGLEELVDRKLVDIWPSWQGGTATRATGEG